MANNPLLAQKNLEQFIQSLNIDTEKKNQLIERIPALNEEERMRMFTMLKDVYLLDVAEQKSLQRLKQYQGE